MGNYFWCHLYICIILFSGGQGVPIRKRLLVFSCGTGAESFHSFDLGKMFSERTVLCLCVVTELVQLWSQGTTLQLGCRHDQPMTDCRVGCLNTFDHSVYTLCSYITAPNGVHRQQIVAVAKLKLDHLLGGAKVAQLLRLWLAALLDEVLEQQRIFTHPLDGLEQVGCQVHFVTQIELFILGCERKVKMVFATDIAMFWSRRVGWLIVYNLGMKADFGWLYFFQLRYSRFQYTCHKKLGIC